MVEPPLQESSLLWKRSCALAIQVLLSVWTQNGPPLNGFQASKSRKGSLTILETLENSRMEIQWCVGVSSKEFQLPLTLVPPSDKWRCFSSAKKKNLQNDYEQGENIQIYERRARAKNRELDILPQTPFVPRFDMLHQIAILLHECVCLKGKMTILLDANHFSADNIW